MLRHTCGFKLANDGVDTRALQHFMGHRNIMHTVRDIPSSAPTASMGLEGLSLGTKQQARFYGQGCCWLAEPPDQGLPRPVHRIFPVPSQNLTHGRNRGGFCPMSGWNHQACPSG